MAIRNLRSRSEAFQKLARRLNMEYAYRDEYGLIKALTGFKLFGKGHSRRIYNLVSGTSQLLNVQLHVFDYQYVIQAGNTPVRHRQTVFFIKAKDLDLPELYLKPEHFFHKIASFFGMDDIDFEEYPEFSDRYLLKGEDEERIRRRMTKEVVHFFTLERGWYLEGVNYYMVLYKYRKLVPPKKIEAFYEKGLQVYDLLKQEIPR